MPEVHFVPAWLMKLVPLKVIHELRQGRKCVLAIKIRVKPTTSSLEIWWLSWVLKPLSSSWLWNSFPHWSFPPNKWHQRIFIPPIGSPSRRASPILCSLLCGEGLSSMPRAVQRNENMTGMEVNFNGLLVRKFLNPNTVAMKIYIERQKLFWGIGYSPFLKTTFAPTNSLIGMIMNLPLR